MKGSSDKYPLITVISNNKTQIRYNILEVTKQDMNGASTISFDFDYVEIDGELTRDKIIDGIISSIHSKSNEFALINNELANPGTEEYANYQLFRIKVKEVAAKII